MTDEHSSRLLLHERVLPDASVERTVAPVGSVLAEPEIPQYGDGLAIAGTGIDQDVPVVGVRKPKAHQRG